MIALGDNGSAGPPVGCNDSLIEVPRDLPDQGTVEGQISAALTDLFSIKDQTFEGHYNALYQSNLAVDSVTIQGDAATVNLHGDFNPGDDCNRPRVEAQIEGTVSQFPEVSSVQVFVNGTALETLLYGG